MVYSNLVYKSGTSGVCRIYLGTYDSRIRGGAVVLNTNPFNYACIQTLYCLEFLSTTGVGISKGREEALIMNVNYNFIALWLLDLSLCESNSRCRDGKCRYIS
ncbi:hypothetical protein SAMN05216299_106144 [Nitrosospira sp. Nsp14]|nr:hypothetical protein SAMN05216299_106144 [Nitrosospira sp. Nsp14]